MYDHLFEFATVRQIEIMKMMEKHGGHGLNAAKELGIHSSVITKAIQAVEAKAARRAPAQHDYTKSVPEGYAIKGVSQYINKEGKVSGQWVKTNADREHFQQMLKLQVETLCSDITPHPEIPSPGTLPDEMLNVIPFGDPHFGMHSWGRESGADFDLKTAESLTLYAVDSLLKSCPKAQTCVILPLGDIFHANDQKNVTPGHGHQLDVDSRFQKIMMVGVLTFRHAVIRALETHEKVVVRFVKGNHDPEASFGLAIATAAFFHDNPRVTVDLSPSAFWYYKHGRVLIGATHGDKVKHEGLPGVMATDKAEWWGQTKHRYWYTGHVHSQNVREFPGVVCESFRTIAPGDAHSHSSGYRSGRDMVCITHHAVKGQVQRHICNIEVPE